MNLIFDLDGTLIDSKYSVLKTYQHIYRSARITPAVKIDSQLLGPSLSVGINMLSPYLSEETKENLKKNFIKLYDQKNYRLIRPFHGIDELLKALKNARYSLYIATNKRAAVVKQIIEYFKWAPFFDGVYSIDSRSPSYADKAEILADIVKTQLRISDKSIYIGDTLEDQIAAKKNDLQFVLAAWNVDLQSHRKYELTESEIAIAPTDIGRIIGLWG